MASFWKRTMVWLGLEDEEGLEPVEEVHGELPVSGGDTRPPPPPPAYPSQLAEPPSGVRTIHPDSPPPPPPEFSSIRTFPAVTSRVHVVDAHGFNDAQEIGERFRGGQPVIANMQDVNRDTARRLVDFASGITFALRGGMQKVAEGVFLLTPQNVEISAEETQRLRERGLMD